MRTRGILMIIAALLALTVGACAGEASNSGAGGPGSADPSASVTPSTPTTPAPTTPEPPPGTPDPTPSGSEITVKGKIVPGVEPGCKVLQTGSQGYLLISPNADLQVGATVVVQGRVVPDMVTTCMQGTPLVVTSVRAG
jgi:hypothetical protein